MATVTVNGIAHVSLVTDDYEAEIARYESILGAVIRKEWDSAESGKQALLDLGPVRVKVSATTGGRAAPRPPGWRSVGWMVSGGHVAHPGQEDLHGLGLEFAADDPAARKGRPGEPADNPLGITPTPTIKIASRRPAAAAEAVGSLVGLDSYTREYTQFNAVGHGIAFDDHRLEFVGSRTESAADLVGRFLAAHGERILCLTLTVADLEQARRRLVELAAPFSQWGRSSLLLGRQTTHRALVELTAHD